MAGLAVLVFFLAVLPTAALAAPAAAPQAAPNAQDGWWPGQEIEEPRLPWGQGTLRVEARTVPNARNGQWTTTYALFSEPGAMVPMAVASEQIAERTDRVSVSQQVAGYYDPDDDPETINGTEFGGNGTVACRPTILWGKKCRGSTSGAYVIP